jgi:D-alanyl-D-alanine carboxypeptidase (penicillin-binding protein 5/6)
MSINRYRLSVLWLVAVVLVGTVVAGSAPKLHLDRARADGLAVLETSGATSARVGGAAGPGPGPESTVAGVARAIAPPPIAPPVVRAHAALLADEATGQVLYERSSREARAMASTTKVMTALLALEQLDQNQTVVIGSAPPRVGEESVRLRQGERFTVRQLLLGLLVKSANDAAVALADAVDGSEASFVRRMNRKAAEMQLTSTHYVTPYGLDRLGHWTSARDLAHLWEVAMRRADFRALVATREASLPGGPARLRRFANTNELLGSYAWVVGGKTGFTSDAGRCLVASASRGGRRLVAVALGSPDAFADVRALFEYGFDAFNWVRLAERGEVVPLEQAGDGETRSYQVGGDVDALVRSDLLGKVGLAPPARLAPAQAPGSGSGATGSGAAPGGAGTTGRLTVWLQAGGMRVAPLPLVPLAVAPAPVVGQTTRTMSSVELSPVPPGSHPVVIDPLLRRAAA